MRQSEAVNKLKECTDTTVSGLINLGNEISFLEKALTAKNVKVEYAMEVLEMMKKDVEKMKKVVFDEQ